MYMILCKLELELILEIEMIFLNVTEYEKKNDFKTVVTMYVCVYVVCMCVRVRAVYLL